MELKVLQRLFADAYNNTHTDFYRALYASRGFSPKPDFPNTEEEWRTLPFLTKAELVSTPVESRTFVRKEDVLFYRISSGTTNQGVMVIPRNFIPDLSARARYTTRYLEFTSQHHFSHQSAERAGIQMIDGDASDLPASAKIAALFKIDGMSVTPTVLAAFIPHLKQHYDTSLVKYIFFWGERISPMKRELFQKTFPHAVMETAYSASEMHGVGGYSCEEMMRAHVSYVHPYQGLIYWELIDPQTGAQQTEEGEIVLTHLWPDNAFPALRYRTGDIARRVEFPCECNLPAYDIVGRAEHDRAVVPGGMVTSAELERALWLYRDHINDDFELHIYDIDSRPRFELLVRPKVGASWRAETIAKNVADSLHISPQKTIRDGLREGLFLEFVCVLLPTENNRTGKQLRIFTHT